MGSNWHFFKCAVGEWGSKARKFKSEKAKSKTLNNEEIEKDLDDFYRGPRTGIYVDMFDIEWPLHEESKIYYVQNIGQRRQMVLEYLATKNIKVLREESVFKWIEIVILEPEEVRQLEIELKANFGCTLLWDGAC